MKIELLDNLPQRVLEVEHLTDTLGEPIDEKIKFAVAVFRYKKFNTSASCEGHLSWGEPFPWIDIETYDKHINIHQKEKLQNHLNEFFGEHYFLIHL